jgi:hypothetical protein
LVAPDAFSTKKRLFNQRNIESNNHASAEQFTALNPKWFYISDLQELIMLAKRKIYPPIVSSKFAKILHWQSYFTPPCV